MNKLKGLSLNWKLLLSNISLLLTLGLVLLFQFNSSLNQQQHEIRKGFKSNSTKLSSNITQNFYALYHNAQVFAKNESMQTSDFGKLNFYFNEVVSLYPVYDFLLLVDMEGNYIASNSLSGDGKQLNIEGLKATNFAQKDWFKAVKEGKLTENYTKKLYGSYFGKLENSSTAKSLHGNEKKGFPISSAVQSEFGEAKAVLVTFANVSWVQNEVNSLQHAMEKEGSSGSIIRIVHNDTDIIYSNEKEVAPLASVESVRFHESKELLEDNYNISHWWIAPEPLVAAEKIDNEKFVETLNWSVYVELDSKNAFAGINTSKQIFGLSFVISLILAGVIGFFLSKVLSGQMVSASELVTQGSSEVAKASDDILTQTKLLSESTSLQASNLHETASSLNEISAMVNKSASHSQNSRELSSQSRDSAQTGMKTVQQMLNAIDEIAQANSEIIEQMNNNSREMKEITNVIREIEEKTKVINDIVFQTKLLSFNASVEAARAGEHGKGFSVVAEEVGTLAKSSGEAAHEIEEMLSKQIDRVNTVIEETQSKIDTLVRRGSDKVEVGKQVSQECRSALEQILEKSANLDAAIEEIAAASIEQSQGIQEISRAMDQLDDTTRRNSLIAQEVSKETEILNTQSDKLKSVSKVLNELVYGEKTFNSVGVTKPKKTLNEPKKEKMAEVIAMKPEKVEVSEQPKAAPVEPVKKVSGGEDFSVSSEDDWEDL